MKKYLLIFSFLALIVYLTGCNSNNTLQYMDAIEQNKPLDVKSLYEDDIKDEGRNLELVLMEKGRIAQLEGDYKVSMSSFKDEIDILRKREIYDDTLPEAQISAGSVLVNDNTLDYRARLFEIEMIYLYQSYNYLGEGSLDGALVEIRRSDFIMNEAEKARRNENFDDEYFRQTEAGIQKKLFENENNLNFSSDDGVKLDSSVTIDSKSEENKNQEPKDSKQTEYEDQLRSAADQSFADMKEVLQKSKSSFLNPYVVFVSGLIHELGGEFDDAYISYKKALELMPSNIYLQKDVIRLAEKIGRNEELSKFESEFPVAWKEVNKKNDSKDNGRLVVIYEDGWIEKKQQEKISLGAVAVAYPVYNYKWIEPSPLNIKTKGETLGSTFPICYMNALTLRALKEEQKWRVIRQAARVTAKGSAFAAGAAMTTAGAIGGSSSLQLAGLGVMAATAVYNNMSENADLRCWMTLPENIQIFTAELPEGKHELTFMPLTEQHNGEKNINIISGKTTVVWIVHVGQRLIFTRLWPNAEKNENIEKDSKIENK